MSGGWLPVPVVAPLLAAALLVLLPYRPAASRTVALGVSAGVLALGGWLVAETHDGTVLSHDIGAWPPGVAIMFAADQFSALMVSVTALLVTGCLSFAFTIREDAHRLYVPLALVLSAGVYGAYLTADLFNLFVFIEVMLAPSYALVILGGGRERVAAGRVYLTVSLLASTAFLVGVGLVYGLTGTVNLGALAGAAARSPAVAVAAGVVLVAMGVKAGVVPLHTWLPRVYPHATPAVTALFSGLLTKVGVYVILRVYAVVYLGDAAYRWLLVVLATATMLVGAVGSLGERTFRAILVFGMVSHIGYMIVGPALFTDLALAAAVFYFVHHVLVKAGLLMCAGAVELTYGTGELHRLGGLVSRAPLLALVFMVGGMSLSGLPPLSGFVAKLTVIRAAVVDQQWLLAVVAALAGLFTVAAMVKIWNNVFWGHDGVGGWDDLGAPVVAAARVRPALLAPAVVLVACSVVFGLGAYPLLTAAQAAAAGLVEPAAYISAVMSP